MSPVLSHYLVFMIGGLFGFVIFAIMDVAKSSDDISDEEWKKLIESVEKTEIATKAEIIAELEAEGLKVRKENGDE